jgi:N-acetylneuraminate lyase
VGANALGDAKLLASHAGRLGTLAIAALAPSYFKPRDLAALVEWCKEIAAAAPETPFYFYDIPSLTGVSFSMPDFLKQASEQIPTLNGIKFTNTDLMAYQRCLHLDHGAFDLPWGVDETLLAARALGAMGAVGSSYNFAAAIYLRLLHAFENGDFERARQEQFRSVTLIHILASYGYMGAAKALMRMLGVEVGPARLPNGTLSKDLADKLRRELEIAGVFDWIQPEGPQATKSNAV